MRELLSKLGFRFGGAGVRTPKQSPKFKYMGLVMTWTDFQSLSDEEHSRLLRREPCSEGVSVVFRGDAVPRRFVRLAEGYEAKSGGGFSPVKAK